MEEIFLHSQSFTDVTASIVKNLKSKIEKNVKSGRNKRRNRISNPGRNQRYVEKI